MAKSFLNPADIRDWIEGIQLDVSSPAGFASTLAEWLAGAPLGAVVAGGLVLVAAMALSRRPGVAALIVLSAAAGAIAFGSIR